MLATAGETSFFQWEFATEMGIEIAPGVDSLLMLAVSSERSEPCASERHVATVFASSVPFRSTSDVAAAAVTRDAPSRATSTLSRSTVVK